MKVTAYVSHHDCSRHDTGWNHPEHQGRLPGVARAVYKDMLTLFEPLLELEGRHAQESDLLLAHTSDHVRRVRQAVEEAERQGRVVSLTEDTVVSGASWDAAVAAVGCALSAVDAVLAGEVRNAFCAIRPPGHAAGADYASGFSLFNNVAVAARHLRVSHGVERVLVAEWGARPGRGTAEIVAEDAGLRFVSVHQEGYADAWPAGAHVVALPAGSGGDSYQEVMETALDQVIAEFRPDFILLSAGFDALSTDPLGGLALEPPDYYALTRSLRQRAEIACSGRLVTVLEGGYDPVGTGRAAVQHLRALADLPPA